MLERNDNYEFTITKHTYIQESSACMKAPSEEIYLKLTQGT